MKQKIIDPKRAGNLSRLAIQSPGANLSPYPQALVEVMECLAPKVAQNHQLLTILRAYVFPVPWQPSLSQQAIRQHLQQSLQAEAQKHLDTFLTILEGMKAIIEHQKLQSPEELDSYLQAHKEMFGHYLLKKAGQAQPGCAGEMF